MSSQTISEFGEKFIIREFIRPLFNAANELEGVGDDCAMVISGDEAILLSTDRVPADLTAFRLGILDYYGLGDYLARLNLSDIAACGGRAVGLFLNLGLPSNFLYRDVQQLCKGFGMAAEKHGAAVLGGDITHASELSISATSIGKVLRRKVLSRRGARPGDSIFVSRPLGVTPAAFQVFLGNQIDKISTKSQNLLRDQFTDMQPMLELGQALAESEKCGSCMDNTDGIGQSLSELSEASKCAFVLLKDSIIIPEVTMETCRLVEKDPFEMIFDGGADFSLVGTLRGAWTNQSASLLFGHPIEIIGKVETGSGLWIQSDVRKLLTFRGWNYFSQQGS